MVSKELFVWVEGINDKKLIDVLFALKCPPRYKKCRVLEYACKNRDTTQKFLHSINRTPNWDYVFTGDKDDHPCITKTKEELIKDFPRLESNKIIIVNREIEGWYLAGLSDDDYNDMDIPSSIDSNNLTKEQFLRLIPDGESEVYFRLQLLERFKIHEAKKKNNSFRYFANKYLD